MRRLIFLPLLCTLLLAAPAGAQLTHIRAGVSAGGVDLSGLTVPEATATRTDSGRAGPRVSGAEQMLGRLHQALRQGRVGVDGHGHVLDQRGGFHRQRRLGDQLTGAGAHDADAEHAPG